METPLTGHVDVNMLSVELLQELKLILKEDYGVELPPDELSEFGSALVAYQELLAKIETQSNSSNT